MTEEKRISIVSAYGRGHWLATSLQAQGFDVTLVDVTQKLGRWAPEDWEGPYGYFHSEQLMTSQLERLHEQDYDESVDQGFTVWLPSGPLDTTGPLSSFLLEKANLLPVCDPFLSPKGRGSAAVFAEMPFEQSWIVYLAYLFSANHFSVSEQEVDFENEPLPIFSPYMVRRVTRKGYEKSLEWCASKGVKVFRNALISDISLKGKRCEGLETQSDNSGYLPVDQVVWMITGEETEYLSAKVAQCLFGEKVLKSCWSWLRYKIKIHQEVEETLLPIKFLLIKDIYLPWSHENFCVFQKGVTGGSLDVWVRVPSLHRFQRDYLVDCGEKVCRELNSRIPNAEAFIDEMPQDFHYDRTELGPNPYPIFDSEEIKAYRHSPFSNIHFENPESSQRLDWNYQFLSNQKLYNKILTSATQAKVRPKPNEVSL